MLVAILAGILEFTLLGWLIDTGGFDDSTLAGRVLGRLPQLAQVLVASGAVWIALSGRSAWSFLGESNWTRTRRLASVWWATHLVLFCAFAWFGWSRLGEHPGNGEPSNSPALVPGVVWIGWCVVGLAALAAGMELALPCAIWIQLVKRHWQSHLVAVATGGVAWFVGEFAERGWAPLAELTFHGVAAVLAVWFDDVVTDPANLVLGTSEFSVTIAPSCSGYAGLGLVVVYLTVFFVAFRKELRFPRVFWLYPAGLLGVWLLNILRIASLIAIGASGAPEVALGGFHSQAGWLAFNLVALSLAAVATRVPYFLAAPAVDTGRWERNPAAAYLTPFLGVVAVSMVGSAVSATGSSTSLAWQVARGIAALALLWHFRLGRRDMQWRFSWTSCLVGAAIYGVWIWWMPAVDDGSAKAVYDPTWTIGATCGAVALRLMGYVVLTPIVEELAFRGYVLRRVRAANFESASLHPFPWGGLVVSTLLFGFFHGSYWIGGIAAGAAYGWLFARRGSLGDSIAAHATTNGLLAAHALITGNWAVWS